MVIILVIDWKDNVEIKYWLYRDNYENKIILYIEQKILLYPQPVNFGVVVDIVEYNLDFIHPLG